MISKKEYVISIPIIFVDSSEENIFLYSHIFIIFKALTLWH